MKTPLSIPGPIYQSISFLRENWFRGLMSDIRTVEWRVLHKKRARGLIRQGPSHFRSLPLFRQSLTTSALARFLDMGVDAQVVHFHLLVGQEIRRAIGQHDFARLQYEPAAGQ